MSLEDTSEKANRDHTREITEALEQSQSGDSSLEEYVETLTPSEATHAIAGLTPDIQEQLLSTLEPEVAADLIEDLPHIQASTIIDGLPAQEAASILESVSSNERADIIQGLSEPEDVLAAMRPEHAADARRLVSYPPHTAGGLMVTEFLSYAENACIGDVVRDLQDNSIKYSDYEIQYLYVHSSGEKERAGALVGVVRFRELVLNLAHVALSKVMVRDLVTVRPEATLEALGDLFTGTTFFGVPVVSAEQKLLGVVLRRAVDEAHTERAQETYLKTQGLFEEEIRSMPFGIRSRRRLGWLSINVLLNIVSASVVSAYQHTLAAAIALAVFMPIISDMSGCSGNQAVAVTLRELVLGLTRPADLIRVLMKEAALGVVNGIALGLLVGGIALVWKGNFYLGIVVGCALALNTVIAVSFGGTIPLLLRRMGFDPALASGPLLTTVTDTCGFFLVLSIASRMIDVLQ